MIVGFMLIIYYYLLHQLLRNGKDISTQDHSPTTIEAVER